MLRPLPTVNLFLLAAPCHPRLMDRHLAQTLATLLPVPPAPLLAQAPPGLEHGIAYNDLVEPGPSGQPVEARPLPPPVPGPLRDTVA